MKKNHIQFFTLFLFFSCVTPSVEEMPIGNYSLDEEINQSVEPTQENSLPIPETPPKLQAPDPGADMALPIEEETIPPDNKSLNEVFIEKKPLEHFAFCSDSLYYKSWKKQSDRAWFKRNKLTRKTKRSLEVFRSEAYINLIEPLVFSHSYDFPVVLNTKVLQWMRYFQTRGRKSFLAWLHRSQKVIPHMKPVFENYGLPSDLIYLSMIESGFSAKALSHAMAVGYWQFLSSTGKRYGLQINDFIDERKDLDKSSDAAAKYLKDLYLRFHQWHMAIAGYNAGEGRIERAMRRKHHSFFNLTLPKETQNYVPKFMAALILSRAPEKFGLSVLPADQPPKVEEVYLNRSLALKDISRHIGVSFQDLEDLNPQIRVGITPKEGYFLKVPEGYATHLNAQITRIPDPSLKFLIQKKVFKKHSLQQLCRFWKVPLKEVIKANPNLKKKRWIAKGQRIYIPVTLGTGQYDKVFSFPHPQQRRKKRVKTS